MKIGATHFKARCLSVLDRVHERGESVTTAKRGRVVAKRVPASVADDQPWLRLAHSAKWNGDALAPAIDESEI